jgi:hypothetical protein
LVDAMANRLSRFSLGASEDLIKNIHGVAPVAELDGDEDGFTQMPGGETRSCLFAEFRRSKWRFDSYIGSTIAQVTINLILTLVSECVYDQRISEQV